MDRAYQSGAAVSAPSAPASPSTGYPTAGNPGSGTPATTPGPYWYHMIMEELMAVISAAGIEPAQGNLTQLLTALRSAGVFQTAPQFDNDTSVATTAFVQRALGNFSAYAALSNAQVLDSGAIGKFHNISAGVTSFTLPSLYGLPTGASVSFINTSNAECTINRSGTDAIATNNSTVNSLVVKNGDSVIFVKATASLWFAIGTAALQGSASFSSSLAASGYQKLPSGLIIQWGNVSVSGATGTVTYPIAFPNATLNVVLTASAAGSTSFYASTNNTPSTTSFGYATNVGASNGLRWVAIGY